MGARICGCADGRVTRTRRTGIGYSQKMNNKRGFGAGQSQAREKMYVLGELLGWWRGWLAGACGWNENERRVEQGRGRDQSRAVQCRAKKQRKPLMLLLLGANALRSRNESRTRRANRRTSLKTCEEGDPLLSLGALALLENGRRSSRAGHQRRGEHARQSKRLVRCLRGR